MKSNLSANESLSFNRKKSISYVISLKKDESVSSDLFREKREMFLAEELPGVH